MFKYTVIEKQTNTRKHFKNLKEVSQAYNMSYALTCRMYRKDFKGKKNHKSIQVILDNIEITDYNPFEAPQ
jgi:hypothetical protein